MKTLEEVVAVMDHVEFCCTNCKLQYDCDEVECFLEDAVFHLKNYQKFLKRSQMDELLDVFSTLRGDKRSK